YQFVIQNPQQNLKFVLGMVFVFHQIIVHVMRIGFLKNAILQFVMESYLMISQFVQGTVFVTCQTIVVVWMDIQEMIVQWKYSEKIKIQNSIPHGFGFYYC